MTSLALQMSLDALALRLLAALEAAGIRAVLVKGPVTAAWLYDDPRDHPYTDLDLLIDPGRQREAERILVDRFEAVDHHAAVLEIYRPAHERAWITPAGVVDLHIAPHEATMNVATQAWEEVWAGREYFPLRGRQVPVMSLPARALQIVLHAERSSSPKAVEDRDRALRTTPEDVWKDVARVASRWHVEDRLLQSLTETTLGQDLAGRLGLTATPTVAGRLAGNAMPEARAIERVIRERRFRLVLTWGRAEPRPGIRRRRLVLVVRLPVALLQVGTAWLSVQWSKQRRCTAARDLRR